MSREQRRHRREEITAEAYFQDDNNLVVGGCVATDISLGGVCIKIREFLPVGSILELQFQLPLSHSIFRVKGKIKWISETLNNEEWKVGLEILDDRVYLKLVEQYIYLKNHREEQ